MSQDLRDPTQPSSETTLPVVSPAQNFMRRFSNLDNISKTPAKSLESLGDTLLTTLRSPSKAIGNEEIAKHLSEMLGNKLSPDRILKAIQHYGAPKVDRSVRYAAQKLKTQNFDNLAGFLHQVIERDQSLEKTLPRPEKEPSWPRNSPNRNLSASGNPKNHFSQDFSNSSSIDDLKRKSHWSIPENKAFFQRLSPDNRKLIVDDVCRKWWFLLEYAKHLKLDLTSDSFIDHVLFKPFSGVLNNIRFEQAAFSLRSKIWNES
jgi:hypothetical protein